MSKTILSADKHSAQQPFLVADNYLPNHNFTQLDDQGVYDFVYRFRVEMDADDLSIKQLKRMNPIIIRNPHGFALVDRNCLHAQCQLMLVYVNPGYRLQGVGRSLIEEVKGLCLAHQPIVVQCYGVERSRFFRQCGFILTRHEPATGYRELQWSR
jgi:GNAT superfamily N-acetyltransferase